MSKTRVRFAPSPTGFFHIGSARTALFNWLYARHTQGTFVLRIEDTDKARNTPQALQFLLNGMQWLGLDWDEGPDCGGDYGPYFQSERGTIYEKYLQILTDSGRAYEQEGAVYFKLEGERYTMFDKYKGAEVEKVRTDPVVIDDGVRGRVERMVEEDFVIRRKNGDFGFHFVNVVDDITMRITHVIRGEDHLSNTARHVEIFQALGATPPTFAHIPLILKGDGKGKMSKRDEGALIEDYQKRGYLPQAVRNYLCLLGWNPKNDEEVMPIESIIERFDFAGINKDAARFDEKKLNAFNTEYLRALPLESFVWIASPLLTEAGLIDASTDEDYIQQVLNVCQEKARSLEDLPNFVSYFFKDDFTIDEKAKTKVCKKGDSTARIAELVAAFATVDEWTAEALDRTIASISTANHLKKFDYFPIARLATTGMAGGPDLLHLLEVLGKERVIQRLQRFED